MKGIWWNIEGLGDPAKKVFIHETMREQKLDFIILLDTGRSNFSIPLIRHQGGLD
jgi:hypothetical protein